jgi:hypothetical protein
VLADPETFAEVQPDHQGAALLLVAAKVGTTRLIDNKLLQLGGGHRHGGGPGVAPRGQHGGGPGVAPRGQHGGGPGVTPRGQHGGAE